MKTQNNASVLLMQKIVLVLLLCLAGCSIVIVCNSSVAWLISNKNLDAGGMPLSIEDIGITEEYYYKNGSSEEYRKLTDSEKIFDGLLPGDAVSVRAIYENISEKSRNVTLDFTVPSSGEIPLVANGKYYYLSTQLRITEINNNGSISSPNVFLLTPPGNLIYFEEAQTPTDIHIADFSIAPGERVTVEFTVEFVNYTDIDQNVYQGFGQGGERCFRHIVAYTE